MTGLPWPLMKTLGFVSWDRYAGGEDSVVVYGWIARSDGRSDFAILWVTADGVGGATSSERYSLEISRAIDRYEGRDHDPSTHRACRRVEVLPEAAELANIVRLTPTCEEAAQ